MRGRSREAGPWPGGRVCRGICGCGGAAVIPREQVLMGVVAEITKAPPCPGGRARLMECGSGGRDGWR